jgi:uncharacterized membrane protein YfcA
MAAIIGLLLVAFAASAVHTSASFGMGIICVMFFPLFIPSYPTVTVCITALTLILTGYNAVRLRQYIVWKWIAPTFVTYYAFSALTAPLLNLADTPFFKRLLGLVLFGLSIYFIFFQSRIRVRHNLVNGLVAGGLSGTLETLFCTGGPPMVLYMVMATDDVLRYTASVQAWFAVNMVGLLGVRWLNGFVTWEAVRYTVLMTPAVIAGIFCGYALLHHMNIRRLKNLVYAIMLVYGSLLMVRPG